MSFSVSKWLQHRKHKQPRRHQEPAFLKLNFVCRCALRYQHTSMMPLAFVRCPKCDRCPKKISVINRLRRLIGWFFFG